MGGRRGGGGRSSSSGRAYCRKICPDRQAIGSVGKFGPRNKMNQRKTRIISDYGKLKRCTRKENNAREQQQTIFIVII